MIEPWESSGPCDLPRNTDPDVLARATAAASDVLWALSGRQYGFQTRTYRPARRCPSVRSTAAYADWPHGLFTPIVCSLCPTVCQCTSTTLLRLPHAARALTGTNPAVASDVVVTIDGVRLDPSKYAVVGKGRFLKRVDGGTWWLDQNVELPLSETGTWGVTIRWGRRPPPLAAAAVGTLACEFARLETTGDCDLPSRITTLSQGGRSVAMLDAMDFLEDGKTGLYTVDLFLKRANPSKAIRRPGVFRADATRWE